MLVFGGSNSKKLARNVAALLHAKYADLEINHFPDGELYLKFSLPVKNEKVIIIQSHHPRPDETLVESVFAVETAKRMGAKKVIFVAPYLAFMRQDKEFHPGECISSRIMAKWLSAADEVITIDPHLHRYKNLNEVFKTKTKRLSANLLLAAYIDKHFRNEIIIGPDAESYQWAEHIAKYMHLHAHVMRKERFSSRKVRVFFQEKVVMKGKNAVIVDDIISSGHTVLEAIKSLKKLGTKKIYCLCVHGIFAESALEKIKKAGASVIATDTIENPVGKISVAKLIAESLK